MVILSLLAVFIFISLPSSNWFDIISWEVLAFGVGEVVACLGEWLGFAVFSCLCGCIYARYPSYIGGVFIFVPEALGTLCNLLNIWNFDFLDISYPRKL